MEIKNLDAIESLGHLLAYYKSDLEYIEKFKLFKNNEIKHEEYLTGNSGFQKFINEFRVARNIRKERVKDLMVFIRDSELREVDVFAEEIKNKKLTHNKVMTVLASKIFFLNQPDRIVPMDKFNKKTLGLKGNKYDDFKIKLNEFANKNSEILSAYLDTASNFLVQIEKSVNIKMDFEKYRINRFTDKYLWVVGRKL